MKPQTETKPKNRMYAFAWSTRGFSLGVNSLLLMQATFYATQSLGLSAGLVGTLFLVSKIFDGVTDLIAGYIIDKTHTKWGKARPYELFLIPTWILTVIFFSTPASMGTTGKIIWVFVLYVLIQAVCVTFLSASETTFLARSTTDDELRAKALTVAGILAMLVPTIASIILPQLIAKWGSQPGGWTKIMLVYAVPLTIVGLFRFFFIKEEVEDETAGVQKKDDITLKEGLKAIAKNKYLFLFVGATFICAVNNNLISGVGTYFFQYVMGDIGKMSLIGMLGLLTPFTLLIFPMTVRKGYAMNFVKLGLILAVVGNILKYFAGSNMTLVLIGSIIAAVPGSSMLQMIGSLFMIQCMDYGEWKTGVRVEAMMNSVNGFASKVGAGIASGFLGVLMGATGFVSGAPTQSAGATTAIQMGYSVIPAIFCVLMLVILHFYDLEKKQGEIRADLAKRAEVAQKAAE
ncbi:MAG: glycoside-pentoside-hexuronide (GPH):cation symporter [Faecalicatena sp.]|uniref:MFS transporter n=1 Tax=Faecalicatena sp. TaxID=2005360 RepID=UPI00258D4940|nr:glycoside-pentoside-hexuronide (GPH):cation symporter [Faecalicatena sp.]MCI6467874.1 glycoside-pentoside-hexuronide (GPH):cation symporter [Faecalicatena sp.]MDY5619485.1 glycoside-pentoside-hexuronide (GPH):cation symporter [Lachnospiraceae bacterium]